MAKAVIIGGGIAGLSAGIYLGYYGIESVILEKNPTAGGALRGWQRGAYRIDNCLHWLTGTRKGTSLYRMWRELGVLESGVKIRQPKAFYSSVLGGERIEFSRDPEETRKVMRELSPADEKEIDRFFRTLDAVAEATVRDVSPLKTARLRDLYYYGRQTLGDLGARFSHPLLRAAFPDYLSDRFSSLGLLLAYGAFVAGNADVPAGGSDGVADRLVEKYRKSGGELRLRTEALRIENGKCPTVILSGGERITGDFVICACDTSRTFGKLLPDAEIPARLLRYYHDRAAFPVFSAFQTAISCPSEKYPFTDTTVIPIAPVLDGKRTRTRLIVKPYFAEDGYAPSGRVLLQTLTPEGEDNAAVWLRLARENPEAYRVRKEEMASVFADRLRRSLSLKANDLSVIDSWTPATYSRYLGGFYGSFMSFAITGKALPIPVSPRIPGYPRVFLATQWQKPPGGVPNAALAGKETAELIVKEAR